MFKKQQTDRQKVTAADRDLRQQKDDALFETLGKNKKAKKRKILRTVVLVLVILAVLLAAGISILQRQVRERFTSSEKEVLSAAAQRGTISTVVSGSGMLTNVDTQSVAVPAGVKVTEILVEFGDTVEPGDLLAVADMASVRAAMAELQTQIEELDDQITDAEGDTVGSFISAGVPGRVKAVYGEVGMTVEACMVEHGALAVLSLDGYMAVDVETDLLARGDAVTVRLSDGEEKPGTVERVAGNKATVLVTDNGPEFAETVTVLTQSGQEAGTGTLYVHSPLMVTGYAGTISSVNARLNQQVYAASILFSLKETGTTASYDALLRTRGEAQETLLELLQIQRNGGPVAPIAGSIYSVADLDSEETEETEETETEIVTVSPDVSMAVSISVDESDILSLQLEQKADVTVSSVTDETLEGMVTEIDKTAADGSYTAVITLDKWKGMLPGMTASVDVRIEGVENALLIPAEALHRNSSGYYVYTSYNEEAGEYGGRAEVIPGLSNSNYVEIKSGLQEGDTVYYTEEVSFRDMFGGMGFGNMPGGNASNFGGNNEGRTNRNDGNWQQRSNGGFSGNRNGGGQP